MNDMKEEQKYIFGKGEKGISSINPKWLGVDEDEKGG